MGDTDCEQSLGHRASAYQTTVGCETLPRDTGRELAHENLGGASNAVGGARVGGHDTD